jgi:hypothetical protein
MLNAIVSTAKYFNPFPRIPGETHAEAARRCAGQGTAAVAMLLLPDKTFLGTVVASVPPFLFLGGPLAGAVVGGALDCLDLVAAPTLAGANAAAFAYHGAAALFDKGKK